MQNWKTVTDLSDLWFSCNYGFILNFTKLSIDLDNKIWIYGPDSDNGPIGGVTDNPGCKGDNSPRIIVYDQERKQKKQLDLFQDEDTELVSASGWSHLEGDRILLNSAFIYNGPWDGEGGVDNKIYDLVILDQDGFQEILSGSWNVWAVPDYAIDNNRIYAIYRDKMTLPPKIIIVDLDTHNILASKDLIACKYPRFIEASNDDVFLMCWEEGNLYSLFVFSSDKLTKTIEWKDEIKFAPNLGNNGNGFPMKVDSRGRIWIGYSYILEKRDGNWHLSRIEPDQNMVETWDGQILPKAIFGMELYKNGMLFSIEGGLFYYDIDKKTWQSLLYEFPVVLPMAVGTDNKIYTFTGKYIISGNL